jgi:cellulose synthase/poly-beta-1,6-N-acetylglucosamine synthase-like glycosyltransferase
MSPQIVVLLLPAGNKAATPSLNALEAQSFQDFVVVPIQLSVPDSTSVSIQHLPSNPSERTHETVTRYLADIQPRYVATLSCSCIPQPAWLSNMLRVLEREYEIGACASQIRLRTEHGERLDSAGMLVARDCFYGRRGHGSAPHEYARNTETLCPNGLAALYRWEMLNDIGGFPPSFPDPGWDLEIGLRARCAGWQSWYAAEAVVYRDNWGDSVPLPEAYIEERARLEACITFLPPVHVLFAPFSTAARHAGSLLPFRRQHTPGTARPPRLGWFVARAHLATALKLPKLLKQRRRVKRRMSERQMQQVLSRHRISVFEAGSQ